MSRKTSIRLTPTAEKYLRALAIKLGVSQTSLIEIALRKLAAIEQVEIQTGDVDEDGE
jgi:predicted transcriptional regulator